MRTINRLLAALLALAIAGAGVLTAIEVLVARTDWPEKPPFIVPYDRWLDSLRPRTWHDADLLFGSIAMMVIGLLLIGAAVAGREKRIRIESDDPELDMTTSSRSLARALRNDARAVPGVTGAKARVRRRSARVRAGVRLGDPDEIERELAQTLSERLTSLDLARPPRLRVRVAEGQRR